MKPLVHIVLVNWNGLADTLECLGSLAKVDYAHFSVIVVDNGSEGADAGEICAAYPKTTVLETKKNLGFTGGNNVGIRYALAQGADYVLCLNNDTVVAPDFLSLMINAAEEDPKAGIVTSAIYLYHQPDQLAALGCWVALEKPAPVGHITELPEEVQQSPMAMEVPFAEGCVLMMRRTVAKQIGGFDNQFFAYTEDADLCLRARKKGWHCIAVPKARVWHKVEGSTGGGVSSPAALYYYNRNIWRLVKKHGTRAQKRKFIKASLADLARDWRHCIMHQDSLLPTSNFHLRSMPRTIGVINAAFHCYGAKNRWNKLNVIVTLMLETLFRSVCKISKPLRFIYQKVSRKPSPQTF